MPRYAFPACVAAEEAAHVLGERYEVELDGLEIAIRGKLDAEALALIDRLGGTQEGSSDPPPNLLP